MVIHYTSRASGTVGTQYLVLRMNRGILASTNYRIWLSIYMNAIVNEYHGAGVDLPGPLADSL